MIRKRLPIYEKSHLTVPAKRICSFPFKEMDIKANGDVFCCNWTTAPMGNIQLQSAKEIWHSENAQKMRESVVNKTYEYCKGDQCPWLASPDERGNPFVDEAPDVGEAPDVVNAAYDLTCNLFCNSCRKFLIADQNYQRHDLIRAKLEELGHIKELILIGGGDPFSSSHTRRWMTEGISLADKITIWTNGVLLTRDRWAKLAPETKAAIKSIEVSIDAATPETYHYVRAGGDWDILVENLKFISELRKDGEIENFRINFVVRLENYLEMPAFVTLGKSFGVDDIYFSKMEDWGSFSCNQMPMLQVHTKNNSKHNDFLRILESPELQDPVVRLGNLRGRSQDAAC